MWTILCGKVTIDSQTNNVSLIDITEEITLAVDPEHDITQPLPLPALVPISLDLVSVFQRNDKATPERAVARATFVRPNGESYAPVPYDIDLTTAARGRCVIHAHGLPVVEAGDHFFRVEIETTPGQFLEVATVHVEVKFQRQA
jgi:hypothetical protein